MDFIERYLGFLPDGGFIEALVIVRPALLGALIGMRLPIAGNTQDGRRREN